MAPFKQVRLKQRSEVWLSNEILESIKLRDHLLKHFKKYGDQSVFEEYKVCRNKTQKLVLKAKTNYFKSKLDENKNNSKGLWKSLKHLGMPSKTSKSAASSIGLNIDDEICFDKHTVACHFNSFFTNVASNLVSKLPKAAGRFAGNFAEKFYRNKYNIVNKNFKLSVLSEDDVLEIVNSIGTNKATGLDNLPCKFLKDSINIIIEPLAHLVNLSIHNGVVPDDLKSARVVPLYKKNDKTNAGNYRPVSVLSIVSKVLEKAVYKQTEKYLLEKDLLYQFQSGFRSGFSTDTCLISLTDHIRNQTDQGNYTGMVLLDLQKAFDTVDHRILLQ